MQTKDKQDMDKDLTITVSGKTNTGKSKLVYVLKKFLRKHGFKVEFAGNMDHPTEAYFDMAMERNFDDTIEKIKQDRKIILKEEQLKIDDLPIKDIIDREHISMLDIHRKLGKMVEGFSSDDHKKIKEVIDIISSSFEDNAPHVPIGMLNIINSRFRPINSLPDNYSLRIVIKFKEFGLNGENNKHLCMGHWYHRDQQIILDVPEYNKYNPEYWLPVYNEGI